MFWNEILERVNSCSRILQNSQIDLNTAVATVTALKTFVESKRDCFTEFETKGAETTGTTEYVQARAHRRNVRLIPLDYGKAPEAALTASDKFRTENFLSIIDRFTAELTKRLAAYEIISSRFGFLSRIQSCTAEEIQKSAKELVLVYSVDLDETLGNELVHFSGFVDMFKDETPSSGSDSTGMNISKEQFMYNLILDKGVQSSFPNVEILLRIYLTLMVTNCSAERSFSKMKLIKNRLRSSMRHDRLSHLAILSIENDILDQLNLNKLIDDFANRKVCKLSIGPSTQ